MPMHLVNKMGEPDAPDERFIDVFDGGKLLTRSASALRLSAFCHLSQVSALHTTSHYRQELHFAILNTPAPKC